MKEKITKINIQNIPCYSSIGIHEEEKKMGQQLLIDVHLDIDASSISSDDISNTVSYIDIYEIVHNISKAKSYSLIEALAEEITEAILKKPLVKRVKVKVCKPHIPYPEFQGDVSVEVERGK